MIFHFPAKNLKDLALILKNFYKNFEDPLKIFQK